MGNAPPQVLVNEQTIEDARSKAIREKSVSAVVEELLQGWLDRVYMPKG